MRTISSNVIASWSKPVAGRWCPESIDIKCPHCDRMVNLPSSQHQYDGTRNAIAASCRCPACAKTSFLWVIAPGTDENKTCEEICLHPNPLAGREPILPDGHLQPALERAYHSAIKAYNVGLWDAAAMSCRKTLEGIAHHLKPDGKGPLFEQLKEVFESTKIAEPLIHVADVLRKGGNIGAHFDLERQADEKVVAVMIDLLDYFLEFTFLLKDKADELEKRLESLSITTT